MARKAEVGDRLHVVIDPDSNGGAEIAPADVVHVHDDGTVNVRAHLNTGEGSRLITGIPVYDSRDELESALDEHRDILKQTSAHRHNPGGEREEWRRTDVYRWVQAAYRPGARPAPAAEPERVDDGGEGRHAAPDA